MKYQYEITYEVIGGKRTDKVVMYAKSIREAIGMFEMQLFNVGGFSTNYNEHSIINIERR